MALVVDSENVVNSINEAPDKLRAEIGRYYSSVNRGPYNTPFAFFRSGIKKDFIHEMESTSEQLVPIKTARIFVSGREEQFRDQTQWSEYISSTIRTNRAFLDHQFSLPELQVENNFIKNFHNPDYEDFTKTYGSNQLLNYNLINYQFKDRVENVRKIGDLVSIYDDENYLIDSSSSFSSLIEQFPSRIASYSGSVEEIDLKQRNIYQLTSTSLITDAIDMFPFYYSKNLPLFFQSALGNSMHTNSKYKNIMQSLKQDLSFANRQFNIGQESFSGKIYNLLDLVNSSRISRFTEQSNELFLVPENQVDHSTDSRRFVEQVQAINFISDVRGILVDESRNYSQVVGADSCATFTIGYKIEKYLDNDVGSPIQTYYTNTRLFRDTQLKYGRRYIYKTKVLIAILGSSYTYSNLYVSQNETEMVSESGELAQTSPSGFEDISAEKYRAYVDVEVTPSFQVLELEIDEDRVAFVDSMPPVPQVHFHNDSKKASVQFFFSPSLPDSTGGTLTFDGQADVTSFQTLTESDERIDDLLSISYDDGDKLEYFNGIYEIYRMETPPENVVSFGDNFLAAVDDDTTLSFPSTMQLPTKVLDNKNGYFEDRIVPNKKYYYVFRAVSYHGTPSSPTTTYEVELQKDSDEYKISIQEYRYLEESDYQKSKMAKRIVRIIPNIERLIFTTEESNTNWRLGEGSLVSNGQTRKFKLRITSKHTGKKMDINLSFLLDDRTNNQQN